MFANELFFYFKIFFVLHLKKCYNNINLKGKIMNNILKETKKYKLLSFIRYLGDGFFYPFFALYLSSTSLGESKIGFILSISPLLGIIMNPIYSHFCKDIKKTRKCLRTISILEAIMICIIPFTKDFYLLSFFTLMIAIFGSCHYGLMDSLCAVYCNQSKINYSSIRVFGSGSYIIATAIGGYVCEYLGYKTSFIIAFILFVLGALIYEWLTPIDVNFESEEEKPKYRQLLKNKHFVFFMIFYCLLMGNITTSNSFFSVYLDSRGVTKEVFGFVYSYFVFFEVIVLLVLNKFGKKLSNTKLLIFSCCSLFLMVFVNFLYLPIPFVLAFSAFRGISYGIVLHVSFEHIVNIVSKKWATFGIMLCTLLQQIYTFIFNNINGNLIEKYSYKAFYLISSIAAIIALILAIIQHFLLKKNKQVFQQ